MDILLQSLNAHFKDIKINSQYHCNQLTLEVPAHLIHQVCLTLRDEKAFSFEQLSDLCGIDYSSYAQGDWKTKKATSSGFSRGRTTDESPETKAKDLAVVYHLLSLKHNHRLRLKVFLPDDPPQIQSVTDIWSSADWYEREAFDLFGILFLGHPDLRRILTDYGFIGHPLRKDFPLEGHVEVRYDPDKKRVIYQPTTIENRVLVPRVLRDDSRYQ